LGLSSEQLTGRRTILISTAKAWPWSGHQNPRFSAGFL